LSLITTCRVFMFGEKMTLRWACIVMMNITDNMVKIVFFILNLLSIVQK